LYLSTLKKLALHEVFRWSETASELKNSLIFMTYGERAELIKEAIPGGSDGVERDGPKDQAPDFRTGYFDAVSAVQHISATQLG
jgi:hypothetical protein